MRFKLIILFSVISLSASAQLLHIQFPFKKKHAVLATIRPEENRSICNITADKKFMLNDVQPYLYDEGVFYLEAQEKVLLKTAKHNMSWRIYNTASYNFSDLAQLYIRLHRFSEAKWYLLQSNNISREENDDKHTIANLVSLALVKENIGDLVSARADLSEARDMAQAKGMKEKVEEIEKKIPLLGQSKSYFSNKYADSAVAIEKDL